MLFSTIYDRIPLTLSIGDEMKKVKRMVDRAFVLYLIVGVLNFIVCTALMFFLFNACGFSEHLAPLFNYGLGSLIWFLGCKYIIFPGCKTSFQQILRFTLEVAVCYVISYYLIAPYAAPFVLRSETVYAWFTFGGGAKVTANCEMAIGALAYALLNYFGQRYFVFTDRFEYHKKQYAKK